MRSTIQAPLFEQDFEEQREKLRQRAKSKGSAYKSMHGKSNQVLDDLNKRHVENMRLISTIQLQLNNYKI